MNKIYYFHLMFIALTAFAFTSCSEDDSQSGSGGSSQSATSSVITTESGERMVLTSVSSSYGDRLFTYDSNGLPTKIYLDYADSEYGFAIEHNPFKISFFGVEDDEIVEVSGTINKQGYLTTLNQYFCEQDGSYKFEYKANLKLEYDKAGQLIQIIGNEYENDYQEEYSNTVTAKCTWQNGNLTRIDAVSASSEGENEQYTVKFGYSNQPNTYKRYTYGLSFFLFDDVDDEVFPLIGMTGKGSDYLPTSISFGSISKSGEYREEETYTCAYTLNEDKTIAVETISGNNSELGQEHTYAYARLGEKTRTITPYAIKATQGGLKRHNLFKIHRTH